MAFLPSGHIFVKSSYLVKLVQVKLDEMCHVFGAENMSLLQVRMAEHEWMIQWDGLSSGPPHFSWHSVGQNLIMCTHLMAKEAGKVFFFFFFLALHLGGKENNQNNVE